MAANTLKILNGSTEINFLTDAAYRVINWAPAVAQHSHSFIGGSSPYEEVVEEMELFIGGATALAKLATLQWVMYEAERWSRGDIVDPTILIYEPESASAVLYTVITGPVSPGAPMIELPPNFTLSPSIQAIDPVILRFKRVGWWVEDTADTGTSASVTHPTVATMSGLTVTEAYSPIQLRLNSIPNHAHLANSFILFASKIGSLSSIYITEAEGLATTKWTSVADASNMARGNSVLRYTPTDTAESSSASVAISGASDYKRWAIFINYRNNAAGTGWKLRAGVARAVGSTHFYTPYTFIPAGVSTPLWINLGIATLPGDPDGLAVKLECTATVASGTIDFDAIVLMAIDEPANGRAVAFHSGGTPHATSATVYVGFNLATFKVEAYKFDTEYPQNTSGNSLLTLAPTATAAEAIWLASSAENTDWWRQTDTSSVYASTFVASQAIGHITPE